MDGVDDASVVQGGLVVIIMMDSEGGTRLKKNSKVS